MSIKDLDLILKKDPVIATFPVSSLRETPDRVEQFYATHAKTHLSLGDTTKHVQTMFKWVSGANKGAFIGAIVGNYGEGKTSFLIHVWAESLKHKVFAVPPFEWLRFGETVEAVAAWVQYILKKTYPILAKKADHIYEDFKEKNIDEMAKEIAQRSQQDPDDVRAMLIAAEKQGSSLLIEVSPARFLSYCDRLTVVIKEAGYLGLLVLLDEPEIAAKRLGREKVAHLLFELADELHRRDGDYGVFVSLPQNFLADAQRRFASLPARLQVRKCFPRLKDIYGPDFASELWNRYREEFGLGEEGKRVVSPATLQSIGQVGSSDRTDLSYGPRTVVSAFNRMVFRYRNDGGTYQPEEFVQDCLADEVMANPNYSTRLREVLQSPQIDDAHREAVTFLAAFPNGAPVDLVESRGLDTVLRDLSRRGIMVYKTPFCYGLKRLRKIAAGEEAVDPLSEAILGIAGEFAPSLETFKTSREAFIRYVVPLMFPKRRGQQLLGWEQEEEWREDEEGVERALIVGAFAQTEKNFPRRAITVAVTSVDVPEELIRIYDAPEPCLTVDALVHFRLRWHEDQEKPIQRIQILAGDVPQVSPVVVWLAMELEDVQVAQERLAELTGEENLTALWVLNLLGRMDSLTLPKESDAQWQAIRTMLLRELISQFLDDSLRSQASEILGQTVPGSGLDLLGSIFQKVLRARYPNYSTLIRQPQWEQKVDDYIRALRSKDIPLAYKRGTEAWVADGEDAARLLGTSRMNLTGGAFEGFDNLLTITTKGRRAPVEIGFRMHPLEQQIADRITAERTGGKKRLKIEGRECWWVPMRDLLPLVKQSGYGIDELKKIVDIGKARGSFDVREHKGEQILYCKPIDLEQMRSQLREKLDDLNAEIVEFRKLPDYISSFDPDAMTEKIEALKDDADYDRLVTRLNKAFEQNHQRLPGYFDRLEERFSGIRNNVKAVTDSVLKSREVAAIKTIPSGKSKWCADLGKYIVPNLKSTVDDCRNQASKLIEQIDTCIARSKFLGPGNPKANVELLLKGYSAAAEADDKKDEITSLARVLLTQLGEYHSWRKLLLQSDELYESLVQMASEQAYKSMGDALLLEHDRISRDITDYLSTRNIQGLPSHPQFAKRLEEIDKKRRDYLRQLKGDFDKRKDVINRFLESLQIDRRVTTTFNPLEGEASYKAMYEQAVQHVCDAVSQQLQDIETQERELMYARDVLAATDEARVSGILRSLSTTRNDLTTTGKLVNARWCREIAEGGADKQIKLNECLRRAFEAARGARQLVRGIAGKRPKIKGRLKQMYDLIPERGDADLKAIMLQMIGDDRKQSNVLDESLDCLGELFRKNWVQIKVERRKP